METNKPSIGKAVGGRGVGGSERKLESAGITTQKKALKSKKMELGAKS